MNTDEPVDISELAVTAILVLGISVPIELEAEVSLVLKLVLEPETTFGPVGTAPLVS